MQATSGNRARSENRVKNTLSAKSTSSEIFPPSAILAREIEEPPPSGPPFQAVDGAVFQILDTYDHTANASKAASPEIEAETLKKREKRIKQGQRIAARMRQFDERRGQRMAICSTDFTRQRCGDCGDTRWRNNTNRCDNKLCPSCARTRARDLVKKYGAVFPEFTVGKYVYMLTLTYVNSERLPDRKRLSKDFRNLMRRKFWDRYGGIQGSCYAIEAPYKSVTRQFNVHLHCLIWTLEPIPCYRDKKGDTVWQIKGVNQSVSDMWREITGDSYIVQGQAFDGHYEEIMKYVTKVDELDSMPDEQFKELTEWLKGAKTFVTFGGLRGLKPTIPPEPERKRGEPCKCGCTRFEETRIKWDHRIGCLVPVSHEVVEYAQDEQSTGPP